MTCLSFPASPGRSRRPASRLLPPLLAAGLLLSGCAPRATGDPPRVAWNAVRDDPAQTLALSWMGPLGFDRGQPGSWIQRQVEQRFHLALSPVFLDPVAYGKTRALRFVAGDVPDVFWDGDPLGVRRNAHHGFVLELPPRLLLEEAPHYVDYINRHAPEAWMYAFWHGKLWGVPTVCPAAVRPAVAAWRGDWLRRVGLGVPRTLEQMHEAFRRFTYDDPDGDGRRDTYGFSPPSTHWSLFFSEFFAIRGVLPFDLQTVGGEITWGGIRPEARDVLGFLRQWYAEGLIDPDFVLNLQQSRVQEPLLEGKIGYIGNLSPGADLNLSSRSSLYSKLRQLHPGADLVAAPPVLGPDGRPHARAWGAAAHVIEFSKALENHPEKVVRVLHMLDALVSSPDLALGQLMGRRGLHWDYDPVNGVRLLPPYDGPAGRAELLAARRYESIGFFLPVGLPLAVVDSLRPDAERRLLDRCARPEWGLVNALGKTDVLDGTGDTLADLRLLQQKFYTEIIRGDRPLSDFDTFVALWRGRGGDALLAEAGAFLAGRDRVYALMGAPREAAPPVSEPPLQAP